MNATDLRRSDVAALAQLPSLSILRFNRWMGGDGAAICPAVAELCCGLRQRSDLLSLVAAFPAVSDAELGFGGSEPEGPPLPLLGAVRWRGVQRLSVYCTDLLVGGSGLTLMRILQLLGALDGGLEMLRLFTCPGEDVWAAAVGDAEFVALLRAAPSLQKLLLFAPELTDAAFAGCAPQPCLESLDLLNAHQGELAEQPPALTAAGLRALGAALPGLDYLHLCDGATEGAWIEALEALGPAGGAAGGAPPAAAVVAQAEDAPAAGGAQPAVAPPAEGPAAADAPEQQEEDEGGDEHGNWRLLLAIRAAVQRAAG